MPNLADDLFRQARERGANTALIFEETRFTFAQLAERVRRVAGALSSLGVGVGTRIGLMAPNSPDFIVYQQAAFMLGATFTPLNTGYRRHELAHAVEVGGLQVLIVEAQSVAHVPPTDLAPDLRTVLVLDGEGVGGADDRVHTAGPAFEAVASPLSEPADLADDAVVMMLNTSATTGRAKAVMLTLANVRANYGRTPGWLGLGERTVTLCALPLYNTFGLNQCISALMITGGTMVLLPRFEAQACVDAIARHRCTFVPAVPTMLQKVLDLAEAQSVDLHSIERIMTGGAPVPSLTLARVRAMMGPAVVLTGYGLTEATALVTLEAVDFDAEGRTARPRSIGRVLDGMALRILDADGADAPTGEVGEIALAGPNLMAGYRGDAAATAEVLVDGWLRTGDLGQLHPDGHVTIAGRKKDVIIRGGQNIYPADIEEALYRAPGVAEACAVAKPDAVLGEVAVAFVVAKPGWDLCGADLLAWCKEELARFNVPADIIVTDELPKGPTGKILARELRAQLDAAC